ncbi:MAG: hypothetical protein ACRDYD_10345 [Acidimicrobiales bacterium]
MRGLSADRRVPAPAVAPPLETPRRSWGARVLAGEALGAARAARSRARPPRRRFESLAVLLLTSALAVAWFSSAWSGPATHSVGGGGDSYVVMWYLGWFPFAIGHGLNPLVSAYVWAPQGINLMWNPMILPALVMSPITAIAGVVVSFNVVTTAAPALSAWAAYLAFRRWTGAVPALVGALCFGFSPFVAAESFQHPFLTFLATAPLLAILFDRMLVVQRAPAWRDGLWLGLLVWVQLLVSEEILVMEAVAAGLALVALVAVSDRQEVASRVRHALGALGAGVLVGSVLSAVPLAYQFLGPHRLAGRVHPPGTYVTDLWNFVVPTRVTALSPRPAQALAAHFTGNYTEWGAYVGLPLLAFLVVAMILGRRRRVAWVGLVVAIGLGVLSLGSVLHVSGSSTGIPMPWDLFSRLPLLQDVLPGRFSCLMFLGIGLMVAVGLDELRVRHGRWWLAGWALAAAGLGSLVPLVPYPANAVPVSAAFSGGSLCPARPGASVAVEPSHQEVTVFWQAEAAFCFSMPTGSGLIRPDMTGEQGWGVLTQASLAAQAWAPMPELTPDLRSRASTELDRRAVTAVVIGPAPAHRLPVPRELMSEWLTQLFGAPPVTVDDTLVWHHPRVAAAPPQSAAGPAYLPDGAPAVSGGPTDTLHAS